MLSWLKGGGEAWLGSLIFSIVQRVHLLTQKQPPPHLLGVKYSKCMAFLVEGNETLLWILVETLNNNYYYPSLNYWVLTEYADAVIKNWYLLKWISFWSILGQHGIEVLQSTCVSIMKQSTRQCNYVPAIRNLDIFIVDLTPPPPITHQI